VLALEPGGPDAAQSASAGEDVERRDDLGEVGDVPVGDARDKRAKPDALRHAGEVGERGVALEHVLPLPPDLRDLHEVIHHPQARKPGVLGRAGHLGERRSRRGRMAGPVETRHLQTEVELHRILLLADCCGRRGHEFRRYEGHRLGTMDGGEPLARKPLGYALALAELTGHDLARHR
jgi:hypothetical protein